MLDKMIKIKDSKFQKAGHRGISVYVPKVYIKNNKIVNGSDITIYRAEISGVDSLVIMPKNNNIEKNNTI